MVLSTGDVTINKALSWKKGKSKILKTMQREYWEEQLTDRVEIWAVIEG